MSDQVSHNIQYVEQATNVQSYTSAAAPAINVDKFGTLKLTAQAVAITSVVVSGTPLDGQRLTVRLLDNGSARAITWGASFEAVGAALPTTTTAGKRGTVSFIYDATTAKFGSVYAAVEA